MLAAKNAIVTIIQKILFGIHSGVISATNGANMVNTLEKKLHIPYVDATTLTGNTKLLE